MIINIMYEKEIERQKNATGPHKRAEAFYGSHKIKRIKENMASIACKANLSIDQKPALLKTTWRHNLEGYVYIYLSKSRPSFNLGAAMQQARGTTPQRQTRLGCERRENERLPAHPQRVAIKGLFMNMYKIITSQESARETQIAGPAKPPLKADAQNDSFFLCSCWICCASFLVGMEKKTGSFWMCAVLAACLALRAALRAAVDERRAMLKLILFMVMTSGSSSWIVGRHGPWRFCTTCLTSLLPRRPRNIFLSAIVLAFLQQQLVTAAFAVVVNDCGSLARSTARC